MTPAVAQAHAAECNARGRLLAAIDVIADKVLAGATVTHNDLSSLAIRRGAHSTAVMALAKAIEEDKA